MRSVLIWHVRLVLSALVVGMLAMPLGAQVAPAGDARGTHATRAELEAAAAEREQLAATARSAEVRARRTAEAAALRQRLKQGDFLPGDRLVVSIEGGEQAFGDTLTVREGQLITLPELADISLAGVLRSELEPHLQKEIARYLRNPTVRATSLVRVAVLGAVGQPGFYAIPADTPLGDVIMFAGGPTGGADMDKSVLRRGGQELLEEDEVQVALQRGATLDQLNVRPGDEVVVGSKRNWRETIWPISLAISTTLTLITFLSR